MAAVGRAGVIVGYVFLAAIWLVLSALAIRSAGWRIGLLMTVTVIPLSLLGVLYVAILLASVLTVVLGGGR